MYNINILISDITIKHIRKDVKVAYEIDFIGVDTEAKQNADAICFRWKDGFDYWGNPLYKVGVFDGGFEAHGKKMVEHMNQYYFNSSKFQTGRVSKVINFLFVSHPDQDHSIGIKAVLENFTVEKIYMNRPWLYIEELWEKVKDGRITKESLYRRLREKYKTIAEIEDIALEKNITIYEAFQGEEIEGKLLIASPSKKFYLTLLVASEKTPLEENKSSLSMLLSEVVKSVKNYAYSLLETWTKELLREDVETSPENETSIVLRGIIDFDGFLLVGDAGVRALNEAIDYLESLYEDVKNDVQFYQVPHHGSRRNINPSTLNRMLGSKVAEGETRNKTAIASVAKNSDHPLKMVTNAYIRRGVTVYKTDGITFWHHKGDMPERLCDTATPVSFSEKVEAYEE